MDQKTIELLKFHYEAIVLVQDEQQRLEHWNEIGKIEADYPNDLDLIKELKLEVALDMINRELEKRGLPTKEFIRLP